MKTKSYLLPICLWLAGLVGSASAQGLVKFSNTGTTLVSYGGSPTTPGSNFYYALLTAPIGTADPFAFTFTGLYATNTTVTTGGRFQGGSATGIQVPGWAPGESRAFLVTGWSAADFGHDWHQDMLNSWFVGVSSIGEGVAGGVDSNGTTLQTLPLFGPSPSITTGFEIVFTPEPTSVALAGLGMLAMLISRRASVPK